MGYIPAFEGHPVESTRVQMSGSAPLDELNDEVIGVDDVVQMIAQFRCVGVRHEVDSKTGNMVRVQVLRPVEMALSPIDPTNPNDVGIARALPMGSAAKDEQ